MDSQVQAVIITAAVSVGTTIVATLYGPAWKDRVDANRARQRRSQELIERYSEPLAGAAFELQSRLYNIYKKSFASSKAIPDQYRRLSTLWLFGQFLAWVEIVRRETQVIDHGDVRRTAELHISRYASQRGKDEYDQRRPRLSRRQAILINHLLDRFGRPRLLIRSRRPLRH